MVPPGVRGRHGPYGMDETMMAKTDSSDEQASRASPIPGAGGRNVPPARLDVVARPGGAA